MSPPQRAGSSVSFGNFGRSASRWVCAARCRSGPGRPDEEARPEPDRQGELGGGEAERLTGIRRRRIGIQPDGAVVDRFVAGGHPLGHAGPLLEHRDHVGPGVGRHVERAEVHPVLGRGDDARLALAAERHRPVQAARGGVGRRRPPGEGPGARGPDHRGRHPGGTEQLATGQPGGCPVSLGSDGTLNLTLLPCPARRSPAKALGAAVVTVSYDTKPSPLRYLSSIDSTASNRPSTRLPSSASRWSRTGRTGPPRFRDPRRWRRSPTGRCG